METSTAVGTLTLLAGNGINLMDNLKSVLQYQTITLDADSDNSGDGTLTLASTKLIDSNEGSITITAFDIDLAGQMDAGTGSLKIHASGSSRMRFGDGTADSDMVLGVDEMQRITANDFTLGGPHSGNIIVDGLTDLSTAHVATISLVATTATSTVTFETAASVFNKGIVVQASSGIEISGDVTTQVTESIFDAGTGTFIIRTSDTLSTSGRNLQIKANDLDMESNSVISTGPADVMIDPYADVGLGAVSGKAMTITDAEIGSIIATGRMTLGSSTGGDITVAGITDGSSGNVATMSLVATDATRLIIFETASSTFNKGIEVQAGAAVVFSESVTTQQTPTTVSARDFKVDNAILSTTNQALTLTIDAITFSGANPEVDTGTANATVVVFTEDRPIDVGASNTANALHLSTTEINTIKCDGLSIGGSANSNITVDGITDTSTRDLGVLSLRAYKESSTVTFANNPSFFNKGISVQAAGGVHLTASVTTKDSFTTIYAGTGTLTVESSQSLSTTGQDLLVTSDDVELGGAVDSGAGITSFACTTSQKVSLGTNHSTTANNAFAQSTFKISNTELAFITAAGASIGGTQCDTITVANVSTASSQGIAGTVTLSALQVTSRCNLIDLKHACA